MAGEELTQKRAAEQDHHGHGTFRISRCHQRHLDIDWNRRVCRVVHVSDQLLLYDGEHTCLRIGCPLHAPTHRRHMGRDATDYLALEVFDNLGASLVPPLFGCCDRLPVFQRERIRQISVRIGLRFLVIRVMGVLFISTWSRTKGFDTQLIHHVLMILFRSPVHRRRLLSRGQLTNEERKSAEDDNPRPCWLRVYGKIHVWLSNQDVIGQQSGTPVLRSGGSHQMGIYVIATAGYCTAALL
jgi:hypothetical protein